MEVLPPLTPLYVKIDDTCRNWHSKYKKLKPIPQHYVLPVRQILQGHSESLHLWANHIHKILTKLNFTSCSHKPCLCTGIFNGSTLIFLCQVDDFAIASSLVKLADMFLDELDKHLKQKLKCQGLLSSFNGLDILQTKYLTKVSC